MKYLRGLSILLLLTTGYALDNSPWFPPPLEFQGEVAFFYEHVTHVSTPEGNFHTPIENATFETSLNVTPWPFWNLEGAILFTHTHNVTFAYEAALVKIRYAWLDDIAGDLITLVTGATLSFPANRFLHALSFDYHGNCNIEFHATLGKEWSCGEEWLWRSWVLFGYGVANKGQPWVHTLGLVEKQFSPGKSGGLFVEAVYGLGPHNLVPFAPFTGYASIGHQAIDIGAFLDYAFPYCGTLSLLGWYNLHARNFISHYWGATLSLTIPFSIL